MKAHEITDATTQEPDSRFVVEMPNGNQVAVKGYIHGEDERGNPVIILQAGRKIK